MRKILVFGLVLFLFLFSIVLFTQEIMPLKDVRPGMKGYGLTVYEGFKIERFDVEILGIVKIWLGTVDRPVILAKLSGGPVNYPMSKTKVVAGMSGSPVFIDGKLIGAVAYSFGTIPLDAICGISPIELMLNPYSNKVGFPSGEQLKMLDVSQGLNPIPLVLKMPNSMVSFLKEKFSKCFPADFNLLNQNFIFSPVSQTANENPEFFPVEPGSAISVGLVKGDINFSAVGTVTAIYGNKIYAFGHPFFNFSKVSYPIYPVKILTTFSDMLGSFKIPAEEGREIGVIENDYFSGVSGTLGKKAEMLSYKINLNSNREKKVINCQIAQVPELTPSLIRFLTFWILYDGYKEIQMQSEGLLEKSINIETKIEFKDLPSINLNHIYNFVDIQMKGWKRGNQIFDYVTTLEKYIFTLEKLMTYYPIPIEKYKKFSLTATFDKKIEPFQIEKITTDKEKYRASETMSISIILSRMNGNNKEWYKKNIEIPIPGNVRDSAEIKIEVGNGEEIFSSLFSDLFDKIDRESTLIEILNRFSNTRLWMKVKIPTNNDRNNENNSFADKPLKVLIKDLLFLKEEDKTEEETGWVKFHSSEDEGKIILYHLLLPEKKLAPVVGGIKEKKVIIIKNENKEGEK